MGKDLAADYRHLPETLGWANLPSLALTVFLPGIHVSLVLGRGLPANAYLGQGLELKWVGGREPGVSPSSNLCFTG